MSRLNGKRTLITGGTSGIGLETARQFIAEGARVAVTGTNPQTIEQARAVLGPDALILRVDAADVQAQAGLARTVGEAFGGIDAVFVNAGVADLRPIEAWDAAGFDRSFDINLRGPFFLIQALLPWLAKPASIVLNTSINAHIGMPTSSVGWPSTSTYRPIHRPGDHPSARASARRPPRRTNQARNRMRATRAIIH